MGYKYGSYLLVKSGEINWAMPVDLIDKVSLDYLESKISKEPAWISGVIYDDDRLIATFDFQGLLKQRITESKGCLICNIDSKVIGFIVSEIGEVIYVSKEEYRDAISKEDQFVTIERNNETILLIGEDLFKRVEL